MTAAHTTATMSFLFVDQVGSTAQLARLGDHEARPVRQALHELLTSEVVRQGGEVVDNTGDGVMAVFAGAGAALEAGVAMQRAAAAHNRCVAEERGIHLRVGIHTGEVTADDQGRWFGMPVVVAARLCAAAETDGVWTSALVAALVGSAGELSFDDLGPYDLKGVAGPVPVVAVRWPDDRDLVVLPGRLAAARRTPLSGRADELRRLLAAWDGTADGTRAIVLLAGEPGIGKSRLAAEAAYEAARRGATVVEGGCEEQLPTPFGPFVAVIRGLVDREADISPALARMVPDAAPGGSVPSIDPVADRRILFEAVDDLLAGTSERASTVVMLEDLHWSDEGTLQLLGHLARSPRPGRLLVIATYRESDLHPEHPLSAFLAGLWRTAAAERIALDGLDGEAIKDQAAAVSPDAPPPEAVAAALAAVTDGNPFFVGEVLRHLADTGALPRSDAEWVAIDIEALAVPDRVRDVVRERAGRLGEVPVAVLRNAAVMGREFSVTVLEELDADRADQVLDSVEAAARAGLVHESPDDGDRYRFRHALIRQALYEELSAGRRTRLHRALAEVLDRRPRIDPAERAFHWALGAGPGGEIRAVESAEEAGAAALQALAFEEAVEAFMSALVQLDRLEGDHDAWRGRILVGLGTAISATAADRERRDAAFIDAADCARRSGDAHLLGLAALGLAGEPEAMVQGEPFPTELLEEALAAVPEEAEGLRARLQASLSAGLVSLATFAPTTEGENERSDALADASLHLARKLGDADVTAFALRARLRGWFDPLAVDQRRDMARELVALGLERNDQTLEAWGRTWEAVAVLELGDRTDFVDCLERTQRITDEVHNRFLQWMTAFRWVTLDALDGRLDDAEQRCDACLVEFQDSAFTANVSALWAYQMLFIRFCQGRLGEMTWLVDLLPPELPTRAVIDAIVHADVDRPRAAAALDRVVADLDRVLAIRRSAVIGIAAFAASAVGQASAAAPLRAAIAPFLSTVAIIPPCSGSFGLQCLPGALLAELDGDLPEALRLARVALEANERAENKPMATLARFHLGRLMLASEEDGGAGLLARARSETTAMGMIGITAAIDRL